VLTGSTAIFLRRGRKEEERPLLGLKSLGSRPEAIRFWYSVSRTHGPGRETQQGTRVDVAIQKKEGLKQKRRGPPANKLRRSAEEAEGIERTVNIDRNRKRTDYQPTNGPSIVWGRIFPQKGRKPHGQKRRNLPRSDEVRRNRLVWGRTDSGRTNHGKREQANISPSLKKGGAGRNSLRQEQLL